MNALDLTQNDFFLGKFDIINASWLYSNAKDEETLVQMMRNIKLCLKNSQNSKHFGVDVNSRITSDSDEHFEKYSIHLFLLSQILGNSALWCSMQLGNMQL